MTQLFTAFDYAKLNSYIFQPDYPGFKPEVVEAPNGDGKKDDLKRYAHIADKYLFVQNEFTSRYMKTMGNHPHQTRDTELSAYLDKAHNLAIEVAVAIGVPRPFWPVRKNGALRVLEYDSKATTAPHTDFDLFTLSLYRNLPQYFKYCGPADPSTSRASWLYNRTAAERIEHEKSLSLAQSLNSQVHFGEILEEIDNKAFCANDHTVVASNGPWQYSIVYFCLPDCDQKLPSGIHVGQWLDDRLERSRYLREKA